MKKIIRYHLNIYKKYMLDQNLEGLAQKVMLPRPSEVQNWKGMAGLIFEPGPWNSVQILIFQRSSNDIYITFWYLLRSAIYQKAEKPIIPDVAYSTAKIVIV